jgi:HAD superfamily hydrolase (TIGR01484 family)
MLKLERVFFDVDGTVIGHGRGGRVSKPVYETFRAMKQAEIAGHPVTSRSETLMRKFLYATRLTGLASLDGGASIVDMKTRELVEARWLEAEQERAVCARILDKCVSISYGADSARYDPATVRYQDITKPTPAMFAVFPSAQTPYIREALLDVPGISAHYNAMDGGTEFDCVQVVEAGVDKGYGEERIIALTGASRANSMAIGDGGNDKEMFIPFQTEGINVAMGNAVRELRDAADYSVPSVAEDGFACALRPFLPADVRVSI